MAVVYDVLDTEGEPLPEDVAAFFAYRVMRAAGQVEPLLGLTARTKQIWSRRAEDIDWT